MRIIFKVFQLVPKSMQGDKNYMLELKAEIETYAQAINWINTNGKNEEEYIIEEVFKIEG